MIVLKKMMKRRKKDQALIVNWWKIKDRKRSHKSTVISVAVSGVNVVKVEWIAVAYERDWYPDQFVKFDEEQEEMKIHFVHRSSSDLYWFVRVELSNDVPDILWVSEGEWNTSCSGIHSKLLLNVESTGHCTLHLMTICYILCYERFTIISFHLSLREV